MTRTKTRTGTTAGRKSDCSFGNPGVDKDKGMNWKSSCNCVFVAECCAPQSFSSQHVPKGEPAPQKLSLLVKSAFFVTFKHFLVIPGGSSSWVSLEAYLKKTKIKQLERELLSIFITETIISTFTMVNTESENALHFLETKNCMILYFLQSEDTNKYVITLIYIILRGCPPLFENTKNFMHKSLNLVSSSGKPPGHLFRRDYC